MKNKLFTLILSVMLLCPAALAYANAKFYDFEDYTKAHTAPQGWAKVNETELSPAKVDDAHGTSLGVLYKGLPTYIFSETVSQGQFLISFEIYFNDFNQNLRLHTASPSSGKDSHSVLRFTAGEIQAANTSADAWIFDKMTEIEEKRWYQIDMLFDMDEGKLHYYVDGVEYESKTIAFSDMSRIIFRTESGKDNSATFYLDNVSFKYKSAGGFETAFKNGVGTVGEESIVLNFRDAINSDTISGIEVYDMGNNPFSYTKKKIDADVVKESIKTVRLNLSEPLKKSTVYKIYAPNIKTVFGDELTNDTAYFGTAGATSGVLAINADFSTVENVDIFEDIKPIDDVIWEKGGRGMVHPLYTDDLGAEDVAVAEFVQHKGASSAKDNYSTLTRTITSPYDGKIEMEFKLKAKLGRQKFIITDSESNSLDVLTFEDTDIKVNGETIFTMTHDTWYTFGVAIDTDASLLKIKIDGEEKKSIDVTLADVKGAVFEQRNLTDTYGTSATADECAHMMIAYFKLYREAECTSVVLAEFEDIDGNVYYPDGNIPTKIAKINLIFSELLNQDTLENGVTLAGKKVSYDYENGRFSILLPDYLSGKTIYEISVANTVKDKNNVSVAPISGTVTTDSGVFEGRSFEITENGGAYTVSGEVIHTDLSCTNVYVAYAAYKGNLMVDYKLNKIIPTEDDRKITFSDTYVKVPDADRVIAFLWDGFNFMNPILRAQIIE